MAALFAALVGVPVLMGLGYYRLRPWTSDFLLYYRDARVGWVFGWSHLYDLTGWDAITRQLGIQSTEPNSGSLSLPLLSWLVAPFALLPMPLAYAVWLLALLAIGLGAWWWLAPETGSGRLKHLGLAAIFVPLVFGLALGSAVVIAFGAVAGCWWLAKNKHSLLAGMVLTLVLVRPQVVLLVPLCLLLAGSRRVFAGFLAGAGGIALLTLLTIPLASMGAYLQTMREVAQQPATWEVASGITLASVHPAALALLLRIAVVAVAGSVSVLSRWTREPETIAITTGILGSLLITPYVHLQDLTMLLAAAWLSLRLVPASWAPLVLVAVASVANFDMSIQTPLPALLESGWLAILLITSIRVTRVAALPRVA